jgi:splicing factor 3B subunit 3
MVLYTWKDKVLAGIGKCLRYYEVGHKHMLRKAEVKNLASPVNTIKTWGERIFATEVNDSFHMYKYKMREHTFYDIADDVLNRYITTTAILDYHTMIGADKFENIFVSRVPPSNYRSM